MGEPTRRGRSFVGGPGRAATDRGLEVALNLARRQRGVVSRRQLLDGGVSARVIEGLIARGYICPLHRGVYRVGAVAGAHADEMAAVLACGAGAVISCRSAGALWRLLAPLSPDHPVDVLVPWRRGGARPGLRIHRGRELDPAEMTVLRGIPVTTAARTILDLAGELTTHELERVIARAERAELVDREGLLRMLRKHPRRAGNRALATIIGSDTPVAFTRSEAEAHFLARVRKARLPTPRVNVRVRGLEVDFYWPAARLIVEIDGFSYHGSPAAIERDHRRDQILTSAGLRVMRVTWRALSTEGDAVIARVAQGLVAG